MNNSEIFHNVAVPLGGRFQREGAPEHVKNEYDMVEERAQNLISACARDVPNLPPIHFDFVRSGEINAIAFRSNDRYFIGFYTGTLFMLRSTIGRFLSDSRLFRDIGSPEAEGGGWAPLANYVPDAQAMLGSMPLVFPNDPIRQVYAEYLEDQAIMFFVGHELTHIVHGHVGYIEAKWNQRVMVEVGRSHRNRGRLFERQCLELAADKRSIISRIDSIRFTFDRQNPPVIPWRTSLGHPVEMIRDWAISVNILFRLLGNVFPRGIESTDSFYPPLWRRLGTCETAVKEMVADIWGKNMVDRAKQELMLARNQTQLAFDTMLGYRRYKGVLTASQREYDKQLQSYWHSKFWDRLLPYAYE